MSDWSLSQLLSSLHGDIQNRLETARKSFGHSTTKGDGSENVWLDLLNTYLPKRYHAAKAHIVDSKGVFSQQIDVVVFDRQYSPFIFQYEGQIIIPAESVYAVFEAKQTLSAKHIKAAQVKAASVRKLFRTSLPIPTANGLAKAKIPHYIFSGFLAFESEWSPPFGASLEKALNKGDGTGKLDLGCVAAHGHFNTDPQTGAYIFIKEGKPATAFLFNLIALLQGIATVPMIDISAYGEWLK
jgi:hypothetical protein